MPSNSGCCICINCASAIDIYRLDSSFHLTINCENVWSQHVQLLQALCLFHLMRLNIGLTFMETFLVEGKISESHQLNIWHETILLYKEIMQITREETDHENLKQRSVLHVGHLYSTKLVKKNEFIPCLFFIVFFLDGSDKLLMKHLM